MVKYWGRILSRGIIIIFSCFHTFKNRSTQVQDVNQKFMQSIQRTLKVISTFVIRY